jgi:hypothetical protein
MESAISASASDPERVRVHLLQEDVSSIMQCGHLSGKSAAVDRAALADSVNTSSLASLRMT